MVLIANTSNMPVAAREASIYTGITIAEYYRDMGYDVALMADSTSRWAEAMREISGRLEEMPGEEGYPAYLSSRLAEFYERAGKVLTHGREEKTGTISIIGAVSPPGGDFSEPVTQNTLRIVKVFWALDAELAYQRHFPAINWLMSYSLYAKVVDPWWEANTGKEWQEMKLQMMEILQKESEIQEIIRLVGPETLPEEDKLSLIEAELLRESYLRQFAFHPVDTFSSPKKQYLMLMIVFKFFSRAQKSIDNGALASEIRSLPIFSQLSRMGTTAEEDLVTLYHMIEETLDNSFQVLGGV
jgi:V/A-type H+-transporting ATPase subunit A